jgi:RNA polymerase sigma-70 factor (ECF subfamily)
VRTDEAIRSASPLPDEGRLVRQAKAGDSDAFAQLYDAYVERVYRYVYFRVTDDMTAEDLTSQVFLKAWEHLDRYQQGGSPFLAWLYTIARNQVIDHYRTHKATVALDDVVSVAAEGRALDDEVQEAFNMDAMRDALQFLTEEQQQVLILKFIADLPTKTIAKTMDLSEGAIRAVQMRALQTMAKHLDKRELQ